VSPTPSLVVWTEHALAKAAFLGFTRVDVETAVLEHHGERRANTGAADWTVRVGRLIVAYSHPDRGDDLAARVVTLWRAR